MQVPERFDPHRMARSEALQPLVVTHFLTLRRGGSFLEVRTVVENTIRDHRLRVLLPSGASSATSYLVDQAFDVVERPIAIRADNYKYKELEVETKPQQTWTAVHDQKRGLAVVSTGLPESAVRDLPDRPIALTLFRSFQRAVFTPGNEGGQIQGTREFKYRIVPLEGPPDAAQLCRMGQQLGADIGVVAVDAAAAAGENGHPPERNLPPTHSFLQVNSPQAVLTAVHRRDGEAATVRLFNPTREAVQVQLELKGIPATAVFRTDLEGKRGDSLGNPNPGVRVPLKPKQIATVQWST